MVLSGQKITVAGACYADVPQHLRDLGYRDLFPGGLRHHRPEKLDDRRRTDKHAVFVLAGGALGHWTTAEHLDNRLDDDAGLTGPSAHLVHEIDVGVAHYEESLVVHSRAVGVQEQEMPGEDEIGYAPAVRRDPSPTLASGVLDSTFHLEPRRCVISEFKV